MQIKLNAFSSIAIALALTALSPNEAWAKLESIAFPGAIIERGHSLQLNGVGLRRMTVFNVKVYSVALYLEKLSQNENEILKSPTLKKIELVFLRDLVAKDIVDSWERGYAGNCDDRCLALRPSLQRLNASMIDVKEGQRVTFFFNADGFELGTPGKAPQFFSGKDFARIILATFIGVKPPSQEVKDGLLGKLEPRPTLRGLSSLPENQENQPN